jgi:drug/metabolite transporter (DMT)-like permease
VLIPRTVFGACLSLSTVFFGIATGILIKEVSNEASLLTTLFYRFLFCMPLLVGFALYKRGSAFLQVNQKRTLYLRILFGFSGICFWFMSVRTMPLGQATALFQSSVIFITLASPFALGEKVGIYRWSAVLVGMVGVVIVTDPFAGTLTFSAIFGVMAAISGAVLAILLRRLGRGDVPATVAVWYNGAGFVVISFVILAFPAHFIIFSGATLYKLIALGVIASFAQILLTSSYLYADAVVVASMRYVQMPLSGLVGYFMFAEVLSATEMTGAAIIIGSCLVIVWRELVKVRAPRQVDPVV